jgi:hypothetical protein
MALIATANAEPCGAVLYRENSPVHYSYFNVPDGAYHHYFGFLEGPAWENKYCGYRTYVDSANRNIVDFILKYQPVAVLHYFNDPTLDEHANNSWGTDCFSAGTTMGLGAFRLFYNNQWLNPQIGKSAKNLDSLVIRIADSSTQTPKVIITYYGWNYSGGNKITVTWTMTTNFNERPAHCEVNIVGNYTGKVVVGMTNNNKRGHPVTLVKDSTKAILATIGKQGGLSEGFTDTLLLAVYAPKEYFSTYADDSQNYGMVLTPDANHTVKWSIAYSEARESSVIYRSSHWQDSLFPTTSVKYKDYPDNKANNHGITSINLNPVKEFYTVSGQKINFHIENNNKTYARPFGIYIERASDGILVRRLGNRIN